MQTFTFVNLKTATMFVIGGLVLALTIQCHHANSNGNNDKASIAYWNELILQSPEVDSLYYHRAMNYLDKFDAPSAIEDLKKALELAPGNPLYYQALHRVYFDAKQYVAAVKILEEGVKQIEKNLDLRLRLAQDYIYTGRYTDAERELKIAALISPHEGSIGYLHGLSFQLQGDTISAKKYYQKTIQIDPDNYEAYMQMAGILRAQKNDDAEVFYKNAIEINPDSPNPLYDLAMYYQETQQYAKATATFKNAIGLQPQHGRSHYGLGYVYFQLDSISLALRHFERCIKVDPVYVNGYYMVGLCHENLANYAEAKRFYEQTLVFDENYDLAADALKRLKEGND